MFMKRHATMAGGAILLGLSVCVLLVFMRNIHPMQSIFSQILHTTDIATLNEAITLLPINDIAAVTKLVHDALHDARHMKQEMLALKPTERTYHNTILAYDHMIGILDMAASVTGIAQMVSTDVENRLKPYIMARQEIVALTSDRAFYHMFKEYEAHGRLQEKLCPEQEYFIAHCIKLFELQGYNSSQQTFTAITKLQQDIETVKGEFLQAIDNNSTSITCRIEDLPGVAPSFIQHLKRNEDGSVVVPCTMPARQAVLPYCEREETRKAFSRTSSRKAFPESIPHLEQLINLRRNLANMLGFKTYAAYNLADTMIKTPEAAHAFLDTIAKGAKEAVKHDIAKVLSTKPKNVTLRNGKPHSWDLLYLEQCYKKATFSLEERQIAEYFPVDKAVAGMFAIYEQFMGITLEYHANIPGAWDPSVNGITVLTKDKSQVLGHIILDLFPRPQKYEHACCGEVIPHVQRNDAQKTHTCYVGVVIANFPAATSDAPSLLSHRDVQTFFHEFGHALHGVLSDTMHTQSSGTRTKMDFVELPSQILEEWMWDKEMLKLVSSHYKTGKPLPDQMIDSLIAARMFGRGLSEARQTTFGLLSLELYEKEAPVAFDALLRNAYEKAMPQVLFDRENKFYASFGHLADYGAGYYGYALSRSYAYDVFETIKKHGLLDAAIGQRFVSCILQPAGSKDPNELLKEFLGRPTSSEAYLNWLTSDEK